MFYNYLPLFNSSHENSQIPNTSPSHRLRFADINGLITILCYVILQQYPDTCHSPVTHISQNYNVIDVSLKKYNID